MKAPALKYNDKKITALSSYIYTVKAGCSVSGKSYVSKYNAGEVIQAAPAVQKISAVKAERTGIRIKWAAQKKCDGYYIYRKKKGGSWVKIKAISSGSANYFLDKTAQKGVLYYYAVKAYVKEPYGNVYSRYTVSPAVVKK